MTASCLLPPSSKFNNMKGITACAWNRSSPPGKARVVIIDPLTLGIAAMLASEEADAAALEAVENLLESYFVQIDSTFDKLEAVGARRPLLHSYINCGSTRCIAQSLYNLFL